MIFESSSQSRRVRGYVAAMAGVVLPVAAQAQTCSESPVTAQGEPSRYQWVAKTKAHANWRAKVRTMSGLGPDWASWRLAADSIDDCSQLDGTHTCNFTGRPCKK